ISAIERSASPTATRLRHPRPSTTSFRPSLSSVPLDQADAYEYVGHPLRLGAEVRVELVPAHVGVEPVVLYQSRLPRVARDHGLDGGDQGVTLIGRDARRRDHAAPVGDVEFDVLLPRRRGVDALHPFR